MMRLRSCWSLAASALLAVACGSSDPTDSAGTGSIAFTTWGEDYIEMQIPPDVPDGQSGFSDGWTVHYEKFLVTFSNIQVADAAGHAAGGPSGSILFDQTVKGVKPITTLDAVGAKAWENVSYEIVPATADTTLGQGATEDDKQMMVDDGYSVYVRATATNGAVTKHYAWGFDIATHYGDCHSEQDGKDQQGLVVTTGAPLDVQLTIHGDHIYYDRLQASPDPAVATKIRFDSLAAADDEGNADGEITLDELRARVLDVTTYDPSGLGVANFGDWVTSLARTIGHFRGEGECTISKVSGT